MIKSANPLAFITSWLMEFYISLGIEIFPEWRPISSTFVYPGKDLV